MTKRLLILGFFLLAITCHAATITGLVSTATLQRQGTNLFFEPLTRPNWATNTLYTGVTNRTSATTNGAWSITLAAGGYRVRLGFSDPVPFLISVPDTNVTNGVGNYITNAVAVPGTPFVLKSDGTASNLTLIGPVTFGGEARTNWPTGGGGSATNAIENMDGKGTNVAIYGASTLDGSFLGGAGTAMRADAFNIGQAGSGISEADEIVSLWNTWTGTQIDIDAMNGTNANSAVRWRDLTNALHSATNQFSGANLAAGSIGSTQIDPALDTIYRAGGGGGSTLTINTNGVEVGILQNLLLKTNGIAVGSL